jgi:Predicted nucleotidyltransferases
LQLSRLATFPAYGNFCALFFGSLQNNAYLCQQIDKGIDMSTQTMIQKIAEYFQTQPVLKAWLFGSYSRGEQRADSDIDILILPDKSQHFSLFTLSGMYEDLKDLLGCEVDLITEGGLLPFARETADRDKILIYERAA